MGILSRGDPRDIPRWMEKIHDKGRQCHQPAIQHTEVDFVRDEVPSPALSEFERAIEIPDHDERRSQTRSEGEESRVRHLPRSKEKQQPQDAEDRH